jgi:surface polysaccharide O-acyltransferase-like enzyme
MLYRILIPTFVFSVVFVIIHYCEIILAPLFGIDGLPVEKTDLRLPIVNWLKGVPHATMWFMYMIIGLYIVTPILVMIKKSINEKWYLWLGVGLFIYSVIINYTCELIWIAWFMQWIGYFVLGNVIHDCVNKFYDKNKSKKLPYVLLSISFLINFLYWFIFTYNTNDVVIPSSFSVPVIIGTILQFVAFAMLGDKITIGKNIKLISKYSFKIYMLHPIILEVAMQVLGRIIKWFPIAILIPIYSLGVTALCCIIAFGIECVKNKNCLGGKYK